MAFLWFLIAISLPVAKLAGLAALASVSWWIVFIPLMVIVGIWVLFLLFTIGGFVFMAKLFNR